jgi:hypothetical protein
MSRISLAILSYGYTLKFLFDINLSVKCFEKNNVPSGINSWFWELERFIAGWGWILLDGDQVFCS